MQGLNRWSRFSALVSILLFSATLLAQTPATVTNPASATVNLGATASFSVTTGGSPAPAVEWMYSKDGGATWAAFQPPPVNPTSIQPTLTFPVTSTADNYWEFEACVTNAYQVAPVCSNPALLTLNTSATVSTPANVTVNAGGTAIFAVTTGGTPAPTIQWYTVSGSSLTPILSCNTTAQQTALVFPLSGCGSAITTANNGLQVEACVTNAYSPTAVCSGPATLTVNSSSATTAPTVSNPANGSASVGGTATFNVVTGGTPAPYVQWFASLGGPFAPFQVSTPSSFTPNLSFTVPSLGYNNLQLKACVSNTTPVTQAICSSPATLTINTAPTVTNPAPATVNVLGTAIFSVTVGGSPAPSIQWQYLTGGGWAPFEGGNPTVTQPTLIFAAPTAAFNNLQLRACVTNTTSTVCSSSAALTVNSPPTITNPSNASVSLGATANFSVTVGGVPAPTVQWQVLESGSWLAFETTNPTSTQPTLSFPATTAAFNNLQLRACATNTYQFAPVCSAPATLTVLTSVVLTPSYLIFPTQVEGTPSGVQTLTVTNKQSVPLNFSGVSVAGANSGDFAATQCATVAPNASCMVSVTFTPTGPGTRTAILNVADDGPDSPQSIALTGVGNPPVTVLPGSITTFTAPVGTISAYQTITITNNNSVSSAIPVNIGSFVFTGDFKQTSTTCGASLPYALPAGASCNVTVSFYPTVGGTRTGQLQVNDDAITTPQVVNLSGAGTSPLTISNSALIYSAQKVGTVSPVQVLTLTNHESQPETFTLAATTNFTASSNCNTGTIAANSSCMISVAFAPAPLATPGPVTGSLTIAHSAPVGSPLTVSLTGSATTTNPPAAVAVVSPGAGSAGTVVPVIITGNGWTNFSSSSVITFTDTNSASIPSDITVTIPNPALVTANQIPAQLTIGANSVGNPVTYGARNITVTTPLSAGGNETAQLNSAFIIADPSNAHSITSVTPAFGIQGQTLNVTLTATGTHFVQGTTYANFGDGVTVNSLTITDATDAQANVSISNTTPIGYRTITMVTGGEYATSVLSPLGNPIFQIGPNAAKLISVNPNTEGQGWSGQVFVTASGTHFLQNATQVSIGGGVIVGNVTVDNPTTATVQIAVPPNATPGVQDVTVSTGGEIATLGNAFSVISTTPYLASVTPSSAVQGQTVSIDIKGVNTNFSSTAPAYMLADMTGLITVNSITVNSPTDVVVNATVKPIANVGSITARLTSIDALGNATIFPFSFTVTASSASIVSVAPSSVAQGAQVTLTVTGSNTIWDQSTTTSAFYPEPSGTPIVNEITINSPTSASLNITVPTGIPPGTYPFYMATGGQVVSSSITVYANTPSLTMSPANGLPGNTLSVTFNGQFTSFVGGTTFPVIAGQGVTISNFTVISPVSATATVAISPTAATTTRLVTLTTGGQIVTTYFNVTSTPVGLISISPYHAPQNTTLDVAMVGLNTHFTPNVTTVQLGPQFTVNSVTVTDSTHLSANITTNYLYNGTSYASPIGWEQVYVNTGAEMLIGGFSVDAPASPTLVSVIPSSAAQGSTENVTITGSLTNWVNGTTEAILGAGVTVANLTITSPTTATATISVSPTAPVGGNSVTMITGSEIEGGTGFSVTPSGAEIIRVGPSVAKCSGNFIAVAPGCGGSASGVWVVSQTQTSTLSITGVATHWLQGETTMSFGSGVIVDSLTINSPTTATAQITVLSSSPVGYASLTSYTDGEVVTLQQAIDIEEGYPTMLAIAPSGGAQGANLTLQVLGRFTHWTQGVTSMAFNQDITVNSITVIDDDNLTANITVSPWAYVDYSSPCGHVLTVTTGNEQVSTAPILDNFCVTQGAAQINSVSASSGGQGTTLPITIIGSATNFLAGVTTVSFGDPNFAVGQITVNSPTSLTASVAISTAATAGYKTVTVTTYGEVASQQYSFTVIPNQATLTEANPYQEEQGVQNVNIVLTGQYSHFNSLSTATFGAGIVVNSVTQQSATQVTANISIDPLAYTGGRTVTVTTPGVPCAEMTQDTVNRCPGGATTGTGSEIVSYNAFSVIPGPAIITQVAPNTGNEGQEVVFTITGANTHWAQNFTQFYIAGGGSDLTINSVIINSPTTATVDMNISTTANPGTRSVFMVTAGESLTDSGAFVVTGGVPVVTYISPNSAVQGTNQLGVTINGLYTNWDSTTTVNFGTGVTVTSYQVEDNTHIQAVLNVDPAAQPGYRTVVVATGTQGLTGNFLVTAPAPPPTPYIWYYWPSSGLPGQTFTIHFSGSNTHWDPNPVTGTQATFGNGIQVNTFQVTGATSAIANITITATAAQSNLIVFTTGSETESVGFNVVVSVPTLSIVDPGSGLQGATNLTVNILGQYTTFDGTTTFNFGSGITTVGAPVILGPTIATQVINIDQLATLGGRSVTATTTDTPGGAQVVGGAGFSVTPSLALISQVTPNTAAQGATPTVEVTGGNTHWDGSTVFNFGDGITVTSTVVHSATDATLILSIPPLASIGATDVRAQTQGEVAYITNGFVVTVGTPLLLSSGPGSLPQQSSATFTILSQATTWSAASPPTVSLGAGVVITNVNVTTPTSMTVSGYVQPTTSVGYRDLTVTSGTQVLTLPYAFYVRSGPAVINSITPSSGGQNVNVPQIQIVGTNTHWLQGVTTLSFPGVLINSFTVNTPVSITANITPNINASPGQVSVTATTLGEVAAEVNGFTIVQTQPELLAAVPSSGPQGKTQNVVLTGLYTHFDNTSVVSFGTGITVNTAAATDSTHITANVTIQPTAATGFRNVSVVTGTETVQLTNGFNVTTGPAAITTLNPATGGQGTSLTVQVTGSQTNFANGITQAYFYGGISVTGVTVIDALHANINISIPSYTALGSYSVVLTTNGEVATILNGFTVTSGSAQLSTVSPPTGTQGSTSVNVNLTGLFTHFVNGTSFATFGAGINVNSTTVSNSTTAVANITITPTAALGSRTVTVTTGGETASITGGFTVLAGVPTLLSAAPGTGQAGTTLSTTVTGQFTNFTASSTVTLGDGIITNFVTYVSSTQLIANITIPSNASVGSTYVSVTTGAQNLTLNNYFSVTPGTPVITVINPNIGNPSQTLTVTITGQYTNWVNGTTTASFGPGIAVGGAAAGVSGPVTVNSPTSLTASLVISSGATLGPVDVITTTGGEVENVPAGFTVQAAVIPAPSLISLSPGAGGSGMPINSTIVGVFSQPMNRTTITTSTVTLTLTSNPGGYVSVPGTVNVDATGRIVTFTPNSLLAVNSTYNLILTNAIKDATGNTFNYYSVNLSTTDSANVTSPTVIAANPPALSTVGTNVAVQLQFSADMNQLTQTGMVVSASGTPVAGTYSWNSNPICCGTGWAQPGNILTFTPTAALTPGTVYTVTYGSPLADTAGNALTPGSFTFTTGAGVDTVQNYASSNLQSYQGNIGTNIAPVVTYSKPINPILINTGTLELYNSDSGKYIAGVVTLAPNGLSATFTPNVALLPNTQYYLHQSYGNYDADANYLNGFNQYFITGAGQDLAPPAVASISPANAATSVPLNAQVVVRFNAPINPSNVNVITVTPSGGSAISGTATLASDLVTLTFVPTSSLQPSTPYTVQVSGYTDVIGNTGTSFSSTFTSTASSIVLNVSTGLNASGNLITTGSTPDAHWTVVPTASTPSESTFSAAGTPQALLVSAPGQTGFYSQWPANGPTSSWVAINPTSVTGNTFGVYSTTFTIPGGSVPPNLCLVGQMGVDDNGLLGLNGVAIMGNISAIYSLASINIPISSHLVPGANTLALGWGSNDNNDEAFRLGAVIQTCGASVNGLSLSSAVPAYAATGVATSTNVTLNFNNPVNPLTVNSTTLPVMIGYNSNQEIAGNYVVTGSQVVFTPDSPFPTNTNIYVGTCNGPLDLAGDSAGGCYTPLTYFTTGAAATAASGPFQVTAFSPAANATNVGLRAPVTATFNRSVDLNTLNQYDFGLFQGDSQSPWCTGSTHSQDDATVQFNCYALPSSTVLTAQLGTGITDWQGNALTSFTSQFTTAPFDYNTNGTVTVSRPANGASGIDPNEPITLFSNLPIDPSTAANGIQVAQNNAAITGTVNVLDGGYTLEFTPATPFTAGALIQWWTTGSLANSTYHTPITAASGYYYVAASTSTAAPTVQVASPPTYTNPIPQNTIFDVQFNTQLNPSTINPTNIYLYDSTTNLHPAVTYTQPLPNVVRMVPTSDLPANHYIYVEITTGLQSTTSVPATATSWYEYTGSPDDTTLPVIVSAVPYNGATNVGVNVTPGVVLSKPIDPVTVTSSTFQVTQSGVPLAGSFWFNSTNTRVQFMPNAPLPANTTLTMTLNGVQDLVGHPITFSSSFQTGPGPDFTSPSVLWTSVPTNGTVPTNSMIKIQFNESMDVTSFGANNLRIYDDLLGVNVATTLSWSSDQSAAFLVPASPLAAGREYILYVNTGTDLAGNQVNYFSSTFYAAFNSASTAPTVINFNPINGQTLVGTNTIVEAQFSAPIDPNTLAGVTLTVGGTTIPTSPLLSSGNTVLQLIPQAPLTANTTYVMTIAGVKDPAGNAVTTRTNTFTTGATYDIVAATTVTYDPPYNSTTGTNVVPKMVFNKPLNPLTVSTSTFQLVLNDTGQQIPIAVTLSADGKTVTLTPQIALLPNTYYRFLGNGSLQDLDGNGISAGWFYFYTGSGAVTTSPTLIVSPLNGATGIPLNAQVLVSISAPIDSTSWNQNSIHVTNGSTPVAGTVSFINSQMLAFAPTTNLAAGTVYTITASGFTDTNGNTVVPYNGTFTTGSVAAAGGLTLVGANIANGSTVTNNMQPIVLTFSQILDPATVNSNTLLVMKTWNSALGLAGTYVVAGNQVTFTPLSPYPAGATIYVGECGGPTDVLGDVFQNGNCYAQQLVYFTMSTASPDTSPLQVLSVSPANGASNVGRDQSVSVTFNKSVNPGSAGSYNAQLFAGQSLQDNGSVTWSADDRTMSFNVGSLYNGTAYTIDLPAGGLTDMSGNALANLYTSTFTTVADPATGNGSVTSTTPGTNATSVPTNSLLTLYLNRQANPSTVPTSVIVTVNGSVYSGSVVADAGGYQIQYTPTTAFPAGATVQWFFSGAYDVYGDALSSDSGYFYTAAAVNAATAQSTVVSVSPTCCGATDVPTNSEVDIQYSQPLNPATVTTATFYKQSGPAITYTVTLVTPTLVRITPTTPFAASTQYVFCTTASLMGTNGVAAQSGCYLTYFTTTASPDTTPGTVTIGPPNSVVNVGTNAYIRLQFSKPADRTTVNSTNVAITTGANTIPGSWTYNYSGTDLVGANFYPLNPLPQSSVINVVASNILDYAGNTFPSATTQFTTAATPDYATPSAAVDFSYWQTGVGTNASFSCRYSEPMDPSSITTAGNYIYSYAAGGAHVPLTITVSGDMMSATLTPIAPLTANSQFIYYCQNAIDLTGNAQSGNSAGFYTSSGPVTTGPTLVYANPPNGSTNVPIDTNQGPWVSSSLGLAFNEPISANSLGNITLTPNGGSPLAIGVTPENGNTFAWISLPSALLPNTTYTYNVTGVTDISGNAITPVTSTFTTGASFNFTNPTVTTFSPGNGATSVPDATTASITFSTAMDPILIDENHIYLRTHNTQTLVPATLTISPDNKTVTLIPTAPLAPATIYDLFTTSPTWYLYDIAGNPYYNTGVISTFTSQ